MLCCSYITVILCLWVLGLCSSKLLKSTRSCFDVIVSFMLLQSVHPAAHDKLPSLKRSASSSLNASDPPKKQQNLSASWNAGISSVPQQKVNDLIMAFVIGDMQAFSVVESPEFIQLVTGLQPGKTVMTRKTLTGEHQVNISATL